MGKQIKIIKARQVLLKIASHLPHILINGREDLIEWQVAVKPFRRFQLHLVHLIKLHSLCFVGLEWLISNVHIIEVLSRSDLWVIGGIAIEAAELIHNCHHFRYLQYFVLAFADRLDAVALLAAGGTTFFECFPAQQALQVEVMFAAGLGLAVQFQANRALLSQPFLHLATFLLQNLLDDQPDLWCWLAGAGRFLTCAFFVLVNTDYYDRQQNRAHLAWNRNRQ